MATKIESWQRQIIIGVVVAIISAVIIKYLFPSEEEKATDTVRSEIIPVETPREEKLSPEAIEMIQQRKQYEEELDILIKEGNQLNNNDTYYFQLKDWQDEALPILEECERRFAVLEYVNFAHYCCNKYNSHGKRIEMNTNENDKDLFLNNNEAGIYHLKNMNALKGARNKIRKAIDEINRGEIFTME